MMKRVALSMAWPLWLGLMTAQILLGFRLYNPSGNVPLQIMGWLVGWTAGILGVWPIITLRQRGGLRKGKDYTNTTLLVDSGVYAVVRHPQYLAFVFLSLFLILVVQHWLVALLGAAAIVLMYAGIVPQADQANLDKFGSDYQRYMQTVPGLDPVAGITRLLRRGETGEER